MKGISLHFLPFTTRNPWDMSKEQNIVLTVIFQCYWAAPTILFLILVPQFFFVAITQYFSALIEDVKVVIKRFSSDNITNLKEKFSEMIDLHWESLE